MMDETNPQPAKSSVVNTRGRGTFTPISSFSDATFGFGFDEDTDMDVNDLYAEPKLDLRARVIAPAGAASRLGNVFELTSESETKQRYINVLRGMCLHAVNGKQCHRIVACAAAQKYFVHMSWPPRWPLPPWHVHSFRYPVLQARRRRSQSHYGARQAVM